MEGNPFQSRDPNISANPLLRIPQREAYDKLVRYAEDLDQSNEKMEREVGIVLPVGCGKSGCITIAPFAFRATRALVVAPNVPIAAQLNDDFDPTRANMFYIRCRILDGEPYPEPAEIRGTNTNRVDLEEADVVITNIQQLQGSSNRWLEALPADFFDLILFDEGHHNVAESWQTLREKFPNARIVNFSATPTRADGQLMAGNILYSYPVFRAIQDGYVKRLKAVVLNPSTLRYVRREDNAEVEVTLDEVRRLGEQDADFRRSIVTSAETLSTIVDASIRELERLRAAAADARLKIIASALNYEHCRQIVEAYRSRGLRADYVHTREASEANSRVMRRLENHEIDVIVQVRKLGEGYDHPFLTVAAVFSVFNSLSPFVQFVGRIMRVINRDVPSDRINEGTVVFHAGANIARRWGDFQQYSEADQDYFDQLLPLRELNFSDADEIQIEPSPRGDRRDEVLVKSQSGIRLEEIPLIANDPDVLGALRVLAERGLTADEVTQAYEQLVPVPTTKAKRRQAARSGLNMRVQTAVGRILAERKLNPEGRELDREFLDRNNFLVLKAAIDRRVNTHVGRKRGERSEFTQSELDEIDASFEQIVNDAVQDVLNE